MDGMTEVSIDLGEKLGEFDIFDLMGLAEMDPVQKRAFLVEMNEVIWKEFVMARLGYLLSARDIRELELMGVDETNSDRLAKFLHERVTNLDELVWDFAVQAKGKLVEGQLERVVNNMGEAMEYADGEKKLALERRQEKYQIALQYAREGEWEKLKELWRS